MDTKQVLVIGGGAAGYFAAITVAEKSTNHAVTIVESANRSLQKVSISGGGRCNVTHACFEPKQLIQAYPRGARELLGAFNRFQPKDTVDWYKSRGVQLKTEDDGRMFPASNSSQTITDCLQRSLEKAGASLQLKTKVIKLSILESGRFRAFLKKGDKPFTEEFNVIALASGGTRSSYQLAEDLGHTIEPCVPSLFTFEIKDPRLEGLSGVSVQNAKVKLLVEGSPAIVESGAVLITNWGLSGPAIIKLSAWGARQLFESKYQAKIEINWRPNSTPQIFKQKIDELRKFHPTKLVTKSPVVPVPKRLWASLCSKANIKEETRFSELSKKMSSSIEQEIFQGSFQIIGKGVFKEEFVTCGGVSLHEIDFRSMESKIVPNLYIVGELLDVDGITGGYNFQSAWTTGFIAGTSISDKE